jgi:hypothetical protein
LGLIGKSSLTGNEDDYLRDRSRPTQFLHETTGDQFFSEEQFEVYRALGFHIAIRLLNGEDDLEVFDARQPDKRAPTGTRLLSNHPTGDPVRGALL